MSRFVARTFQLRGRASRSEYWWWMLVNVVVLSATQLLVPALASGRTPQPTLSIGPFGSAVFADIELVNVYLTDAPSSPVAAFSLLIAGSWLVTTIVPGFAIAVRRFHDSNLSGWWVLLALIPPGPFVLLLLATRRSRCDGARFDTR
ncbi:DUF805 domain-containing protein [Arthrobacter sp. Ld5]|uniref:DUF805 domain-containing protein n=1 Tax=Arthrobacter sp. Ld5 TaxID=649152 RepID=UPI003EB69845